jgi:hypothetical protein
VLEQVQAYLRELLFQLNHKAASSNEAEARNVMQSMIEEMNDLRSTLLRPLHSEVATLMQQRNALVREIRQLEEHRQLLTQPSQLQAAPHLQDQADQALTEFDSTLHVVFESLQKDVQAYQESLSQGIDNIHRLGQQSEAIFSGIVERLTTQIGRDTSALASSAGASLPAQAALTMPYAGSELVAPQFAAARSPSIETITVLTQLIDRIEVDEFPTSVPTTPPRIGNSGREVPSELKQLFQADSSCTEPAIETSTYSESNQETTLEQLNAASLPEVTLNPREPVIFTLEGIENLFADEIKDQSNR